MFAESEDTSTTTTTTKGSDLLKRKLAFFFEMYDVNKNGVLEVSDFEQCAADYAVMNGFEVGSEQYQRTVDLERRIFDWIVDNGYSANNETLTLEEYQALHCVGGHQ